jgi:hypothetical protein
MRINKTSLIAMMLMLILLFPSTVFAKRVIPTAPPTIDGSGNNLCIPAVFAEGIGLTGGTIGSLTWNPKDTNTGLRYYDPTKHGDTWPYLVSLDNFFTPTYPALYLQDSTNCWQAEWVCGKPGQGNEYSSRLDWSDNLIKSTWNEKSIIRVENVMYDDSVAAQAMFGFYVYNPVSDFYWGIANGDTIDGLSSTIFSANARLKIVKLDCYTIDGDHSNAAVYDVLYDSGVYERFGVDGSTNAYSAEISGSGKLIYGYNWNLKNYIVDANDDGSADPDIPKYGWYRLTFRIDSLSEGTPLTERNAGFESLDALDLHSYYETSGVPDPVLYEPKLNKVSGEIQSHESTLDIYIDMATKGKK